MPFAGPWVKGGKKPDPKLEALLADHAQRLKEKQEMAKLESRGADTKQEVLLSPSQLSKQNLLR